MVQRPQAALLKPQKSDFYLSDLFWNNIFINLDIFSFTKGLEMLPSLLGGHKKEGKGEKRKGEGARRGEEEEREERARWRRRRKGGKEKGRGREGRGEERQDEGNSLFFIPL